MERDGKVPTLDEIRQGQLAEDVAEGAGILRTLLRDAASGEVRLSSPVRQRLAGLLTLMERCERNAQSKGEHHADAE